MILYHFLLHSEEALGISTHLIKMCNKLFTGMMLNFMMVMTSSADINSVVATYSLPCQAVLNNGDFQYVNKTDSCQPENQRLGFQNFVTLGFCTELEYNNFTSAVCGQPYGQTTTVSSARNTFYGALVKTSSHCMYRAYQCIRKSALTIVYKQQEQFCALLNVDVGHTALGSCLTAPEDGCTQTEVSQLSNGACTNRSSMADQTFSKAVLGTTPKCLDQISTCFDVSQEILSLAVSENYCDVMIFKDGDVTREACLTSDNVCSSVEFESIVLAACKEAPEKA